MEKESHLVERTDFRETIFEVGNCHEHPFFVITYRVLETSLSLGHPWICKGDAKKQTPGYKYIYLHLRDNSKIPACDSADGDTLYQPRPFLASLTANLFHCYNPYSKQAVEEARIQYKRCTSLKQYMPICHQTWTSENLKSSSWDMSSPVEDSNLTQTKVWVRLETLRQVLPSRNEWRSAALQQAGN